ncbi:MAG: ferredoxin [Actinomycetota bacterium]|nr:ferredoxin [Actinomycetota bacterium]
MKAAPEVFALGAEGLRVLDDRPDGALRRAVERAARRCPTQALRVAP